MSVYADKLFVINKESGPTSFGVVDAFRKATGIRKVGHAGTLDPLANGILLLCTGRATRAIEHFMDLRKVYEFDVRLGIETTTLDAEGDVVREMECADFSRAEIEAAAESFVGTYSSAPPAYSAIKKNGRRLYELAREGEDTSVEDRVVTIYVLQVQRVELPDVSFRMECSRGTYVRSFARDFGARLGMPAHVSRLTRAAVGDFRIEDAFASEQLFNRVVDGLRGIELPRALEFLPGIVISDASRRALLDGGLPGEHDIVRHIDVGPESATVRILDERGALLAIGKRPANVAGRRIAAVDSFRLFVSNGG